MKRCLIFSCILLTLFCGAPGIAAAEETAAPAAASESTRPASREDERSGRRVRGGAQFMERLRSQYPNEVAEIEKLRESDPEAAGAKMRELMGKAGFGRRGRRGGEQENGESSREADEKVLAQLKEKFPEEFASYEELKKTDPGKAAGKLKEMLDKAGLKMESAAPVNTLRDRSRRRIEHVQNELKRRDPEEYAKLEALRESDPDAARREFRRMAREAGFVPESNSTLVQYEYVPVTTPGNSGSGRFGGRGGGFPGGMGPWGGGNWQRGR